jgi:hypothetical protein
MRPAFFLAEKMGEELGRNPLLQRKMQAFER